MCFRPSHFDAADVADVDVRFAVTQDFEVVHRFVFVTLAACAWMHVGNVVDVHCWPTLCFGEFCSEAHR